MTRRRLFVLAGVVVGVVLLAHPWAGAADLYGNVGPGASSTGLAGRYPIGNYSLDEHFSAVKASLTHGVDVSGVPALIAYFLANLAWAITSFIANAVITLFGFAFSLDLLNGSPATGGAGALAPVSEAISGIYAHTFGQAWMVCGVVLAGCWAMWRGLIQRRYTETVGGLALSLVYCLLALTVVARPAATIGEASKWTNEASAAFLSITAHGDVASGGQAQRAASDQLFDLLVMRPWLALDFGGTEHCIKTGTGSSGSDPDSVAVRPLATDPTQDSTLRDQLDAGHPVHADGKTCVNNATYASHFLRYSPDSDDRNAEYDALNDADPSELPDTDPAKANGSYGPGIVDKPATDAMEKGGQYQRLLLAVIVGAGELGAFLLLGTLSISVVLAQILVLLLACFSPVALVLATIPGRGHDYFRGWATRLGTYLLRKATYSLVLAILLAVLSALGDATSGLGWLMSFGLQSALMWTVFVQRDKLAGTITATLTGARDSGRDAGMRKLLAVVYASRAATQTTHRRRSGRNSAEPPPAPDNRRPPTPGDGPPHGPDLPDGPQPGPRPGPPTPSPTRPDTTGAPDVSLADRVARHRAHGAAAAAGSAEAPSASDGRGRRARAARAATSRIRRTPAAAPRSDASPARGARSASRTSSRLGDDPPGSDAPTPRPGQPARPRVERPRPSDAQPPNAARRSAAGGRPSRVAEGVARDEQRIARIRPASEVVRRPRRTQGPKR